MNDQMLDAISTVLSNFIIDQKCSFGDLEKKFVRDALTQKQPIQVDLRPQRGNNSPATFAVNSNEAKNPIWFTGTQYSELELLNEFNAQMVKVLLNL